MQSINQDRTVVTTLRLPPMRHRQLKLAAASRGTSLQKALEEAVEMWLLTTGGRPENNRPRRSVRGILRDVDVFALRRQERRKELERDEKLLHR